MCCKELMTSKRTLLKATTRLSSCFRGQELNVTGPGAGNRPNSDFDRETCTGGTCDRRAQYLQVVTDLLNDDLTRIGAKWDKDGKASQTVFAGDGTQGLIAMLTGKGSLFYGELAGERIKLGLILHDPEEGHDCFPDNTHSLHSYCLWASRISISANISVLMAAWSKVRVCLTL